MQNRTGLRQLLHEPARPTRVIEMHVGEEHIVDGLTRDTESLQRRQQMRHGIVRPDIDESRVPGVLNDVRGRVTGMEVLGIDGRDAVRVVQQFRAQGALRRMNRVCEGRTRIHIVTLYATVCICSPPIPPGACLTNARLLRPSPQLGIFL